MVDGLIGAGRNVGALADGYCSLVVCSAEEVKADGVAGIYSSLFLYSSLRLSVYLSSSLLSYLSLRINLTIQWTWPWW